MDLKPCPFCGNEKITVKCIDRTLKIDAAGCDVCKAMWPTDKANWNLRARIDGAETVEMRCTDDVDRLRVMIDANKVVKIYGDLTPDMQPGETRRFKLVEVDE